MLGSYHSPFSKEKNKFDGITPDNSCIVFQNLTAESIVYASVYGQRLSRYSITLQTLSNSWVPGTTELSLNEHVEYSIEIGSLESYRLTMHPLVSSQKGVTINLEYETNLPILICVLK